MNEIDVIYNRFGKPIFRLLSDDRLVTFPGKNAGFLVGDNLYNYTGKHVGWFSEGLVRDHYGHVVGFGEKVTDSIHPLLPYMQYKPYAGYVQYEPYRPYLQYEPYRPYKAYSWSSISLESLFN
jgi:hypothetical protein